MDGRLEYRLLVMALRRSLELLMTMSQNCYLQYNQRFLEIAESLKPMSILVIGGGVFTLPSALHRRFNRAEIDAVELEELLVDIAKRYFELPSSKRLSTVVADGRDYIEKITKKYDLIVVDVFVEYEIPQRLICVEAAKRYSQILSKKGVLAVNFISRYYAIKPTLSHELAATFESVFSNVKIYPADSHIDKRHEQNLILIASHQPEINLDYLQSAPVELRPAHQRASLIGD